jgi:hypothetical protein
MGTDVLFLLSTYEAIHESGRRKVSVRRQDKVLPAMTQLTLDNANDSLELVDFDQTLAPSKRDTFIGPCLNPCVQEAVRCSSAIR